MSKIVNEAFAKLAALPTDNPNKDLMEAFYGLEQALHRMSVIECEKANPMNVWKCIDTMHKIDGMRRTLERMLNQ